MGAWTGIGWTDHTWNPWPWRCTPISEGCDLCFAKARTDRYQGAGAFVSEPPTLKPDRLLLPLHDKEFQTGVRMFLASMTDPFHVGIPIEDHAKVWAVMASTHHVHQVLTKRAPLMFKTLSSDEFPERVAAAFGILIREIEQRGRLTPKRRMAIGKLLAGRERWTGIAPNVMVGVSVESQKWAERRMPRLVATPAAMHMVSVEPQIRPVTLTPWLHGVDQVILGGESGGRAARPMHPDWARELRDEARGRAAYFFKQRGHYTWDPPTGRYRKPDLYVSAETGQALPEVQAPDTGRWQGVWAVGTKAAGNVLDDEIWEQHPPLPLREDVLA